MTTSINYILINNSITMTKREWLKEIIKSGEDNQEIADYQAQLFSELSEEKQLELLKKLREIPRKEESRFLKLNNKLWQSQKRII